MPFGDDTIGFAPVAEMKALVRECVRDVLDDIMPEIREHVAATVVQSAREAARCALCDEIDFIVEQGNELYRQAKALKRNPSTFKEK